jgi:hypothetical protein
MFVIGVCSLNYLVGFSESLCERVHLKLSSECHVVMQSIKEKLQTVFFEDSLPTFQDSIQHRIHLEVPRSSSWSLLLLLLYLRFCEITLSLLIRFQNEAMMFFHEFVIYLNSRLRNVYFCTKQHVNFCQELEHSPPHVMIWPGPFAVLSSLKIHPTSILVCPMFRDTIQVFLVACI